MTEFLADKYELASLDVMVFVREVLQKLSHLKELAIQLLLDISPHIQSPKTLRATIWLLGEYCSSVETIQNVITLIRQSLGDLPIVESEMRRASGEITNDSDISMSTPVQRLVTADGTYATQSAFTSLAIHERNNFRESSFEKFYKPCLRSFLLDGDFFLGAALAASLCKLVIRYMEIEADSTKQNRFCTESMFIIASILHLGRTTLPKKPMNEDDYDRMITCVRLLNERLPVMFRILGEECRIALAEMLSIQAHNESDIDRKQSKFQVIIVGKLFDLHIQWYFFY